MKTRTAVVRNSPVKPDAQRWEIVEVDLEAPRSGELLIKMVASGLCHSDDHITTGDIPVATYPFAGGHEGAGIVQEVGPHTPDWEVGDHVVMSFLPGCGRCRWCASGQQNLCDLGSDLLTGARADGSFRMHLADGTPVGQMCGIATFSEYTVAPVASCVKVPKDIPLVKACLVGCGVGTGFGSAENSANVQAGDTVIVMGIGGIGINAIQGASYKGASHVIAVDPVAFKREKAMEFGATHTASSMDEAFGLVQQLTRGVMADKAIYTVGVADGTHMAQVMSLISKGGRMVITAVSPMFDTNVTMNLFELTIYQKEVRGALFGGGSPRADIPKLLGLYQAGQLKLDELITKTYTLEQINEGYQDMRDGKNIRGMIVYE